MILQDGVSCSFMVVAEETKTISELFSDVFPDVVSLIIINVYLCLIPMHASYLNFLFMQVVQMDRFMEYI